MIDHTGVNVSNYNKSKAFYSAALAPLSYAQVLEFSAAVTGHADVLGFGEARGDGKSKADFWVIAGTPNQPPIHVGFRAASRAAVNAFYAAALSAGARDNGPPGIRAHYHPNYYAAFVLDPDGHNIEAVCHEAE